MNCALVTGASRGIGKAVSLRLSGMGLHVILNYSSNTKAAEETLSALRKQGGSGELLQFDVTDKQATDAAISKWLMDNPEKRLQVLVNNAGIVRDGFFILMDEEKWNEVIDVSLHGMFHVTQPVLREMMKHKYGRIINITSISGTKGVAGQTNYSAAKAAIIGVTRSLAQETGRMNITVNAVAPGFIETDMIKDTDLQKYRSLIPLGRFGKAEEVAELVAFLSSDKSSYITGEVIHINGGLHS